MLVTLTNPDLFTELTTSFDIDDIIELSRCCWTLNRQLKTSKFLKIMASSFKIVKPSINFSNLIQEYYHRYNRTKSYNSLLNHHLMWCVKDQDIETLKGIVSTFTWDHHDLATYKFYQLCFEAGCRNNSELFHTLTGEEIVNVEISAQTGFYAGQIYSHHIFEIPPQQSDQELTLLLFEAVRGNNLKVVKSLQLHFGGNAYFYIQLLGAVAANNCTLILEILNIHLDFLHLTRHIPIYDSDVLSHVRGEEIGLRLIIYALHFSSIDAADMILRRVGVAYFTDILYYFPCYSLKSVEAHQWLSIIYLPKPQQKSIILRNASCANNLKFTKFLYNPPINIDEYRWLNTRYSLNLQYEPINCHKLPEYFNYIVINNAYKVVSWMLQTFKYSKEELLAFTKEQLPVSNYSKRLIVDRLQAY